MPIISVKNVGKDRVTSDRKIVGVEIPQHYYNILMLEALTRGVTRTTILREIIEQWLNNQSSDAVIDNFIKKIRNEWHMHKRLNPKEDVGNYMLELEAYLMSRGLDEQIVSNITKIFLDAER